MEQFNHCLIKQSRNPRLILGLESPPVSQDCLHDENIQKLYGKSFNSRSTHTFELVKNSIMNRRK